MAASHSWFGRIRALDVRLLAAVAATLLLVIGVMWVVPTTPDSQNFKFDAVRRDLSEARPIVLGEQLEGSIVDSRTSDFYRILPLRSSFRLDVKMTNGSSMMIPGVRIFDSTKTLIQDKTFEFVRRPGADVDVSFLAQSNMTYYVEVLSQRNTNGPYSLTVNIRKP